MNENNEKDMTRYTDMDVFFLTPETARFGFENYFLTLNLTDGGERKHYARVVLRRAFPFDMPDRYISVLDEDGRELGIIENIHSFDGHSADLLSSELRRIYHTPKIHRIFSVKERYGFSYWEVETSDQKLSFTIQDTYRNLLHIGEDRLALFDVDGNRFEIESLAALDRKSYKKLELYL